MKIIHISTSLGVGGAEQMLKRLLCDSMDNQKNIIVISLGTLGVIGEALINKGYQVYSLNMKGLLGLPVACLRLWKIIRQHKPDIIQTWMYHADLLGGIAGRLAGCKRIIWGIRTTSLDGESKATFIVMKLCAFLSRIIPMRVVCVAHAALNSHIRYGYQASKMLVISNGFDFSQYSPGGHDKIHIKMNLGLPAKNPVIGMVGRYHYVKGQDIFVLAAAEVIKTRPDVMFAMVGRGCELANDELRILVKSNGLAENVTLLGERSDIADCLSVLDIYCMPSRSEGFPNGLGEAMAMELPCVATAVGDTEYLTENTVSLVPAQDEIKLAAALLRVLDLSSDARRVMGKRGSDRIRSEFSISQSRTKFESLYNELMELN